MAISYIYRMGGIQFPHLNSLAREMLEWCEQRNLIIFASYIKSQENFSADKESRCLDTETGFTIANYDSKIFAVISERRKLTYLLPELMQSVADLLLSLKILGLKLLSIYSIMGKLYFSCLK